MTISVVTPFHNCPELLPAYEQAVTGAQVVAIDNASENATSELLREMVNRLGNGSLYFRNEKNELYSHANNQGLKHATSEIVVFLNSDVVAKAGEWFSFVERVTEPGTLYGASAGRRVVAGFIVDYLEGWCLWGFKSDFEKIGGWNETDFPGLYWEDNELCYRAERAGLKLMQAYVPLRHLSNYTSSRTPGAYDNSAGNRAVFERMVREGMK